MTIKYCDVCNTLHKGDSGHDLVSHLRKMEERIMDRQRRENLKVAIIIAALTAFLVFVSITLTIPVIFGVFTR